MGDMDQVTIPNSVTTIADAAFENVLLSALTLGTGVTSMGSGYNLVANEVVIPASVTSMGWITSSNEGGMALTFLGDAPQGVHLVNADWMVVHVRGDASGFGTGTAWKRAKVVRDVGENRVVYSAHGGTGSMRAQVARPGEPLRLRPNRFHRPGYRFVGWATHTWSRKAEYKNRARVADFENPTGITTTLYALWKKKP
jgi:hypothetical protein